MALRQDGKDAMSTLPSEEEQAARDQRWRDGRKILLAELARFGVLPYSGGKTLVTKQGPVGRAALVAWYKGRHRFFGFLLTGAFYPPKYGRMLFLRFAHAAPPEPEARLLTRWRHRQECWVKAGCPAEHPPWCIPEGKRRDAEEANR